jgi:hypothetical protein
MAVTRSKAQFAKEVTPPLSQARIRSLSATDALITVEWLNRAKGTKARTDVLALRQKLEDLGARINQSFPNHVVEAR